MDNDNAKELISENNKYYIAVDKKEASGDMKHVLNEMVGFGYEKIAEHEYNGDVIVIYAKRKKHMSVKKNTCHTRSTGVKIITSNNKEKNECTIILS